MKIIKVQHGVAVEMPTGEALPIRQVIGIGLNYRAHAEEQGSKLPDHPLVFVKNPAACTVHDLPIEVPPVCREESTGGAGDGQTDYEAELAVVIGQPVRDIPESRALDAVLGYTCANDVSARWWQKKGSGGQFCRGKSFDTFCPLGPRLVPAGQIADPQALGLRCRLNGQTMQQGHTSDMIFTVRRIIAELSRGTTLLPGTVILTGTPSGVGMARTPPVYLKHGDVVEVEIDSIGTLRNSVRWT